MSNKYSNTITGAVPNHLSAASQSDEAGYENHDSTTGSESPPAGTQSADSDAESGPSGPASQDEDEPAEEDDGSYKLPLDQLFEILKNSRRRETIRYLKDNGGEGTLSDLAEHIAAIENDTTVRAISSSQRKRVYVGLYQCHLPKMDDTGVVDFDQNRGTIELGPNAAQLEDYLDEPDRQEWHKLYLSVALAGMALFVIGQAGGAAYGLTPSVVLLGLLGGIVACALFQSWRTRE